MLKEVKRVLKPGGKMFYMEHIIAEDITEDAHDGKIRKSKSRCFDIFICRAAFGRLWLMDAMLTVQLTW